MFSKVYLSSAILVDVLGQAGGCADAVTARIRSAWKAFHELLPILTNRGISLPNRGNVLVTCVRSVLLYGCEIWPLAVDDLARIKRSDHAMIRWVCVVRLDQPHSTDNLRERLHLMDIEDLLRWNRLRLAGHRHRQDDSSWTKKIMSLDIDGPTPCGRPRLRWSDVINKDLKKRGINIELACNTPKWRHAIRPQMTH